MTLDFTRLCFSSEEDKGLDMLECQIQIEKLVEELKERERENAFKIIKNHKNKSPIKIWCKIFGSVIMRIALNGCNVWGPLSRLDYARWDKHPIESLHAQLLPRMHARQN